jgi:hypothetical protein
LVIPIGLEGLMGNNAWNAGAICCQTNSSIDDAGFAAEMVDLITKRPSDYGISSEMNANLRLFGAGFSNGAGFVQYLTCFSSIKLTAIASISGFGPWNEGICTGKYASSTRILLMHGRRDPVIAWDSKDFKPFPENVHLWADVMKIDPVFETEWINPSIVNSKIGNEGKLLAIGLIDGRHEWVRSLKFDATFEIAQFFGLSAKRLTHETFDSVVIEDPQDFSQNGNRTIYIYLDPGNLYSFRGNVALNPPIVIYRSRLRTMSKENVNWELSIPKEAFAFLMANYSICPELYLSWDFYPTTSAFEAKFNCLDFGNIWNLKQKKGDLNLLLVFPVPKELQSLGHFSFILQNQNVGSAYREQILPSYTADLYSFSSSDSRKSIALNQDTLFFIPFLQKHCFDAEFSINGSQNALLNRKFVLGSTLAYSDTKSTKEIALCASAGDGNLRDLDLAINFYENLDRTPVFNVSLSYQNSYCGFDIFDWTRDLTFFPMGSDCEYSGFLIPSSLDGITIRRIPANSRVVYGVFPSESLTNSGKMFLQLNSTLSASFSYTFGINKIPSGNEWSEIMNSNGTFTSVPIPKQYFNQIVYLRLEFQHQNSDYDLNLNVKVLNVPEKEPDDSGIRYNPPFIISENSSII